MAVDVIIQVRSAELGDTRTSMVQKIAGNAGVAFAPLDPISDDGPLAEYFQAAVPEQSAQELVKSLRLMPNVRAAYIKPAGRPPR